MAGEWYVGKNGQQSGPFTAQQLKQMAIAGQLSPTDLLWKDGMSEWLPCSSVKGLFVESAATASAIPARPVSRPAAPPPRSRPRTARYGSAGSASTNDFPILTTSPPDGSRSVHAVQYAEFMPRIGALLLDGLFAGLITCVPSVGIAIVFMAMAGSSPDNRQAASVFSSCCSQLVSLLIGVVYYVTLETSAKQGTWGKQIVGIKVTDLQGNRITVGRDVGRYFAKILNAFTCGIGLLMPFFTERKQTLHDMVAGCLALKK